MNNKQRVLFVVLAIIGVLLTLQINGALATTTDNTKLLKCTYPEMTLGRFEVPNGNIFLMIVLAETTITVLETTTSMVIKSDGIPVLTEFYRFDASYDKPFIFTICPHHGPEGPIPYEFYSQIISPAALERFFLPVEKAVCK